MDRIDIQRRSWNMSRIKNKNTKPELKLRKYLYSLGYRYRIHYPVSGKPDLVFISKKIAIFIHGCFWHGHGCKNDHTPKSNSSFWINKIKLNRERDLKNKIKLEENGWKVIILWECKIKNEFESTIKNLLFLINSKSITQSRGDKLAITRVF